MTPKIWQSILLTLVYNKTNQTHEIVQIVYLFKVLFLDIYPISPMRAQAAAQIGADIPRVSAAVAVAQKMVQALALS